MIGPFALSCPRPSQSHFYLIGADAVVIRTGAMKILMIGVTFAGKVTV
jgi:hypothetical protein